MKNLRLNENGSLRNVLMEVPRQDIIEWKKIQRKATKVPLPNTRKVWTSWRKSNERPQNDERAGTSLLGENRELGLFSLEKRGSGNLIDIYKYLQEECKEDSFQSSGGNGHEQNHSDFQKTHFQSEDDQALAQLAQGGCGVSSLRDIPKPCGHSAGELA
ncbi:hypothetical protein HGM15179_006984 [Zosterops borbonicus]|uniref:Uncharacterized protein n=1 Tax=Zosterops borbonicus TaxID=364589 RepID=A0A8K1GJH5_9PASS|nr:hypothetical protein HGM15179_006984 [Zosterops borbonicus]